MKDTRNERWFKMFLLTLYPVWLYLVKMDYHLIDGQFPGRVFRNRIQVGAAFMYRKETMWKQVILSFSW